MKSLAKSIQLLALQLHRLQKIPNSDELHKTIDEFSGIMGELTGFIQDWLQHWTRM